MAIKREDLKNIDFSDVADLNKGLLQPTKPGDILLHDFMEPLGMSANALAKALHLPTYRITSIINSDRAMMAETALRLERYFGMDAEFWLNLQKQYELESAKCDQKDRIQSEVRPRAV